MNPASSPPKSSRAQAHLNSIELSDWLKIDFVAFLRRRTHGPWTTGELREREWTERAARVPFMHRRKLHKDACHAFGVHHSKKNLVQNEATPWVAHPLMLFLTQPMSIFLWRCTDGLFNLLSMQIQS